jgi:hypothetical protein
MNHQRTSIGDHEGWIEEPDLVVVRLRGRLRAAELAALIAWQHAFGEGKAHHFLLYDIREAGLLEPAARRVIVDAPAPPCRVTTVVSGAGFALRVGTETLIRARRLLGRGTALGLPRVFAAETEARAFIERTRATAAV